MKVVHENLRVIVSFNTNVVVVISENGGLLRVDGSSESSDHAKSEYDELQTTVNITPTASQLLVRALESHGLEVATTILYYLVDSKYRRCGPR